MNLNYSQTTGQVTDDNGKSIAKGWAGNGCGRNNPTMQDVHCVGPLPQGVYKIGAWYDHTRLGPMVADLHQISGETFGRNDFFIHGPSSEHYGQESKGCIVVPREDRQRIIALTPGPGDTVTVTA